MVDQKEMEALVLEGPGRLAHRRLPVPRAGEGEVLLRIRRATVCGSDVRIFMGTKTRDVRYGHPIGHEAAGVVAEVGTGVDGYAPGDRVAVCVVESCGRCDYCLADRENLCTTRRTLGYHTDGAFAEYMLIPARAVRRGNLFRLPDNVPLSTAALIEPLACCLNGQHEMGLTGREGLVAHRGRTSVVIFGAGPIGLMHLLLVRVVAALPVGHITVVEPRSHRREWALELGADSVCGPDEFAAVEAYDHAIVAVGAESVVPQALRALRACGRLSLFAGFPLGSRVTVDPSLVHYKQIRVYGASESRRRDFAEALNLIAAGRIDPSPLVTHRFALEHYEIAFRTAGDGSALKVAFDMEAS